MKLWKNKIRRNLDSYFSVVTMPRVITIFLEVGMVKDLIQTI